MAAIPAEAPVLAAGGAAIAANLLLLALAIASPAFAVAAVAGGLVVVAALTRPGATLLASAFALIVSADLLDLVATVPPLGVGGFEISLTDLFLALMLVSGAAWSSRRPGRRVDLTPLVREPAFAAWAAFALLGAYDLARGGVGTFSSMRIFGYALVVPLVVRVVETPRQLRLLGLTVAAGGLISSAAAVVLAASGRSVTDAGLSTGGVRGLSIGGSFLVAGALLYVLAAVAAGLRVRTTTAVVVLLLGAGVIASGARETWLGLFGALAILAFGSSLRGVVRLVLVFGLVALLSVGAYMIAPRPPELEQTVASVENRLLSTSPTAAAEDPSVQVRYQKWSVVWAQTKAHPVLGTGFGYPSTYTSNIGGDNFVRSYVDDPENTHLWIWARMGTLGFAAWVSLNLLVLAAMLRLARTRQAAQVPALWGAGIIVVVLAGMAFSPVSAFSSTLLLYWFGISLLPVARRFGAGGPDTAGPMTVERRTSS